MLTGLMIKIKSFGCFLMHPAVMLFSLLGSLSLGVVEKYLFSDWELLGWIVWIMIVETFSGLYRDFKKRELSRCSFDGMLHKSIIYGFVLILYHILKNYTIGGNHPFELDLPTRYLIVGIVLREAVSIIENLAAVTQLIPAWFVNKLRHMDQKGDMQCFKNNNKDE